MAHDDKVGERKETEGEQPIVGRPRKEHGSTVQSEEQKRRRERWHTNVELHMCPGIDHGEDTTNNDREEGGDSVYQGEPGDLVVSVPASGQGNEKRQASEVLEENSIRC